LTGRKPIESNTDTQSGRILLVIPSFRESVRLPAFLEDLCESVAAGNLPVDILTVDDGSGESEAAAMVETVSHLQSNYPFLQDPLLLPSNVGKGGAVYAGWDSASEDRYTWLAFVDADGAVSPDETIRVLAMTAGRDTTGDDCLFAVRVSDGGTKVRRTPIRKILGNLFRFLVRLCFSLPCRDTQCGLKCVPAQAYREVADSLVETRFVFDVELAARLVRAGYQIEEHPISWEESPGTRLNLGSALKMLLSLFAIRWRLFRRR
jgi:dolichyl-phosphate beta-glucosyltransferase